MPPYGTAAALAHDAVARPLLQRLQKTWDAGTPVSLAALLPPDASPSLIAELACRELALRLRAGHPSGAADYTERFPQLARSDEWILYLLEAEILARKKYDRPAEPDEIARRFPDFRERIECLVKGREPPSAFPPGFEIRDEIGRGGMGVVYRAADLDMDREVAVKILRDAVPAKSSVAARFREEARITAQLQHPGIPAVYRVGTAPDGRPYLVMKLIKGRTLAELLRRGALLNALAVFESIAQAVGYAHTRGILHRDLKPANIMVGAFGEVQVMDWGLAKPVLPTAAPAHADPTNTRANQPPTEIKSLRESDGMITLAGSVMGTPAYMAPEQAASEAAKIDHRSDVFGLGGILCVLLTGLPPFGGDDAEEVRLNAVRGRTDEALGRLDRCGAEPDLVALCKRCLAIEPAERPADGGEVAQAVAALRAAAADRARRAEIDRAEAEVTSRELRKRRRLLIASACSGAAVLLAATAVSLWQAGIASDRAASEKSARVEEAKQRERAEKALDRALRALETLTASVTGDSLAVPKAIGRENRMFLEGVLVYYRELADEEPGDEPSRIRIAAASYRIGLIEFRLGRHGPAAAAFDAARAAYEGLPAAPPQRYRLACCHGNMAVVCLAGIGGRAEAEEHYLTALRYLRRSADESGDSDETRAGRASVQSSLGSLQLELGKTLEAERRCREAVEIQEALAERLPEAEAAERLVGLATYRSHLARVLAELGRPGVEKLLLDARGDWKKLVGARRPGDTTEYRSGLAGAHNNLGDVLKQDAERIPEYEEALSLFDKLVGDYSGVPEFKAGLGSTHNNLGGVLEDPEERQRHHRTAQGLFEKLAETGEPGYLSELARSHYGSANALAAMNRRADAEREYRSALEIQETLVRKFDSEFEYHFALARTRIRLGQVLTDPAERERHAAEREKLYLAAVASLDPLAGSLRPLPKYRTALAQSLSSLGGVLAERGRPKREEAVLHYGRSITLFERLAVEFDGEPRYRSDLAAGHYALGVLLAGLGRADGAMKEFNLALAIQQGLAKYVDQPAYFRAELARTFKSKGELLAKLGRCDDSDRMHRTAFALQERIVADFAKMPQHRIEYAVGLGEYGRAKLDAGDAAAGLEPLGKAIRMLESAIAKVGKPDAAENEVLRKCYEGRARAYGRLGKHALAVKDWDRVLERCTGEREKSDCRLRCAGSSVRCGKADEVVAEMSALAKGTHWVAEDRIRFARFYCAAMGELPDKKDELADRAIAQLGMAAASKTTDAGDWKWDLELAPLRYRREFQYLLGRSAARAESSPAPRAIPSATPDPQIRR